MRSSIRLLLGTILLLGSYTAEAEAVFHDTDGHETPFSALKGKWVLINYWAGWCKTCVAEIPEFNRFYEQHKKDPVALFAVNYDALPLGEHKQLIQQLGITYPSLQHNPAHDLRLGDITGVPVTYVYNPEGQLVKTIYGGQTAKQLNRVIKSSTSTARK